MSPHPIRRRPLCTISSDRMPALVGLAALACLVAVPDLANAQSKERSSRKAEREISTFERMTDQMLVDSPNFFVQSRNEATGVHMEGHGLVVSFQTSLVGGGHWDGGNAWWRFWDDDDGDVIVINSDDWDWEDWEDLDDSDKEEIKKASKSWKEKELARQERRYQRGKTEIVELLLDYSDLLSSLPDNEWLEVQASLRRAAYFKKHDLRRLVVRAKMSDLRAFADGKISEEVAKQKIEIKES